MLRRAVSVVTVGIVALAAVGAGCAPVDEPGDPTVDVSAATNCTADKLPTKTKGKLTIATDDPAYAPWFKDNKPDNGEGYESAVAYAVAEKLGFAKDAVVWQRVTFNNAVAPGPKDFDFDVNQFSITEERRKAVDFSSPYYDVRQAVIALKTSKLAGATSLADLRAAKLGAQVGTTSYKAITEVVKPSAQPAVYNNNDDAKKALQNGQVDGLVVDLPTAFYITSAEVTDAKIVGQLPQLDDEPEQFGLVLDKGSKLTACVSQAVEDLRADTTLDKLEKQWLAQVAGAPELT